MGFTRIAIGVVIFYIAFSFLGMIWLKHKKYEFSWAEVAKLARITSGNFSQAVRKELSKNHDKILSKESFPALSRTTGGIHGSVQLLYGSITEFVAVYHAPLRTSGDTGRHFMNMSISVLRGDFTVWNERKQKVERFHAGEILLQRAGERMFIDISDDTYLLLYGRGLLPLTMGYWVSDDLFSSADPLSAATTITYYFRAVYESSAPIEFFHSLYNSAWLLASRGVSYVLDFFK